MIEPNIENINEYMNLMMKVVIENLNAINTNPQVPEKYLSLMLGAPSVLLRIYIIKEMTELTIAQIEKDILTNHPTEEFAISQGKKIAKMLVENKMSIIMISGKLDDLKRPDEK